jgi:hypothetical protein
VTADLYTRHRFPEEIISHGVWLYFRFCLSYRDVEALMAKRGISLTYETVRHWCRKFGQVYASRLRRRRPRPGDKWHLDEVFLTIQGERHYLWRAMDYRACETLWPGVAAGAGRRDPLPADLADDSPDFGPTEGGALPNAGEDPCPKYSSDFTHRRDPSTSRYSLAEEDSGRVRIDKHYPSGIDTCLPDLLGILLI